MPWVVAKFHSKKDDGLAFHTIPSSWITEVGGKNYALYPPVDISGSELKRLVYKGDDPRGDWDLLHLKYISPFFDSIIEALDFECKAGDLSEMDLGVSVKTGVTGKRKRKAKDIRYSNEPVSSEDEGVKETTDPLSICGGGGPRSTMKLLLSSGKAVKMLQDSVLKPREKIPIHKAIDQRSGTNISQTNATHPKNCDDDVEDLIEKIEQRVTCQTEFILKEIRCMKETIEMLSSKVNDMQASSGLNEDFTGLENLITLPVDSFEDLMSLQNEIISSPKYKRFMLKTLKDHALGLEYKGISSLNRTVNSILATMMTSRLACMLCMAGQSKNKVSFQLNFSNLLSLIYDVLKAKKISGPDIDMTLMKRSIGGWLKQAKSRSEKLVTRYYGVAERPIQLEEDDDSIT